jgi:hypothetical protein
MEHIYVRHTLCRRSGLRGPRRDSFFSRAFQSKSDVSHAATRERVERECRAVAIPKQDAIPFDADKFTARIFYPI